MQTSDYTMGSTMMMKRDSNSQCGRSASFRSQHKNAAMITSLYCIQYILYPLKNKGEGLGHHTGLLVSSTNAYKVIK